MAAKTNKMKPSAKVSAICLFWRCWLPRHSPSLQTGFTLFSFFGKKNKFTVLGTSMVLQQNGHIKKSKLTTSAKPLTSEI